MIVLDTNVISEVMRGPDADQGVLRWLRRLPETPVTTVVNRAEVLAGIAILPPGRRTDVLRTAAERAFEALGACLPLTGACASRYADVLAARRSAGAPIGGFDALIAAICLEAGTTLATRDSAGFAGLGLPVIDPWSV